MGDKEISHIAMRLFEYMVGAEGFEPSEWWSQSPLPYHLATPQNLIILLYHKFKQMSIGLIKKFVTIQKQ